MSKLTSAAVILIGIGLAGLVGYVEHHGAHESHLFDVSPWTAVPFVIMLLCIAVLPLAAEHWWESNRNKLIVAGLLAVAMAAYLGWRGSETQGESTHRLRHALSEYASFIILLGALYTISGGILLTGNIEGRPLFNTGFLLIGALLSNLIGTTGASMLLIRPILKTNSERKRTSHIPVFFIFIVSNTSGLLTPLGDPPLFLGFLKGVDFSWTFRLWPQWLVVNGALLWIFFLWDCVAYSREAASDIQRDVRLVRQLRLIGFWRNGPLLLGVLLAVLLQSEQVGQAVTGVAGWKLHKPWGEVIMVTMLTLSLLLTPHGLRHAHRFSWVPIAEVAILFIGIFVTMVPALALLERNGHALGVSTPWQYFWLSGGLSSFLDNAPTYLTFATMANRGDDLGRLARTAPQLLQAISCGAVFMGANTYIGNGPNFMVRAIAVEAGYKMPSFFGYTMWSGLILLPVFGLVTWLFFT